MHIYRIFHIFVSVVVLAGVLIVFYAYLGGRMAENRHSLNKYEGLPIPSVISSLSWYSYVQGVAQHPELESGSTLADFQVALLQAIADFEQPRDNLSEEQKDFLKSLTNWLYHTVELGEVWHTEMTSWPHELISKWQKAVEVFGGNLELTIAAVTGMSALADFEVFAELDGKVLIENLVEQAYQDHPEDHRVYQLAAVYLTNSPHEVVEVYLDCLSRFEEMAFCYERYHDAVQNMLAVVCPREELPADLAMFVGFISSSDQDPWHFEINGERFTLSNEVALERTHFREITVKPQVVSDHGYWPGRLEVALTTEGAQRLYEVSQYFLGQRLVMQAQSAIVAAPVIAGPIESESGKIQINVTENFIDALPKVCPSRSLKTLASELYLKRTKRL